MVVEFRAPKTGDAEFLAANLRPADRAEAEAAGLVDVAAAIAEGIATSSPVWVAEIDGAPVAVLGARPFPDLGFAAPWMLATSEADRHPRAVIALGPRYIAEMLQAHPLLLNHVHAANTRAVRWLRRAGFTLQPAHPHPATGEPFHVFRMARLV